MGAEQRRTQRRQVSQPALMVHGNGTIIGSCMVRDVSAGGARLKFPAEIVVPDEFTLLLSRFDASMSRRCHTAWRTDTQVGVRFLKG